MSLQAIREVRIHGQKPGLALVLIGDVQPPPMDDFRFVVVRSSDDPRLMDWRPMVGLTAAVFTLQPLAHITLGVLDALQSTGVKLFGAADCEGFYPLLENADESHERLLRRTWELLCQS
jgi:hypothetical protein